MAKRVRSGGEVNAPCKAKTKWKHVGNVAVIQRTDWRIEAYERPVHEASRLHIGEGCVTPDGLLAQIIEDYGPHVWTDDEGVRWTEYGYVVWSPKQGRVFCAAGKLLSQTGKVRHLQLVRHGVAHA